MSIKKVLSDGRVPVKIWAAEVEPSAMAQINNLASLPMVGAPIAVMPDVHCGYGMPIGTVLATKGYVIPNAVGVDIGCFTGDTKVALLCGKNKTLKELADEDKAVWVYSLDENLRVVPGRAIPKLTRKNASLVEVLISGGETLRCTPDHLFMLFDGTYRRADALQSFDSLMPLYRSYQTKDGYEFCATGHGKGELTHRMVMQFFHGSYIDKVIHHIDGWFDNTPENLVYLTAGEHSRLHRTANPRFTTEEFKAKRIATLEKNGFYAPELYEVKKSVGLKNLEGMQDNPNWKRVSAEAGQRNKEHIKKFNERNNKTEFVCECGRKVLGKGGFVRHSNHCLQNHKVLSVTKLDIVEDVYCLEVERFHNFALAAGVFVHNCGMSATKTSLTEIDTETLKKAMGMIRQTVPVGFEHHKEPQLTWTELQAALKVTPEEEIVVCQQLQRATHQLGTLGGGNHFIEIQKGSDGHIWIMIHSGSRNLGKQVADYYNKLAVEINEQFFSVVTKDKQLAFLPVDSPEGARYLFEMNACLEFARLNRQLMMDRINEILAMVAGAVPEEKINIHHNYAKLEHHFGKNLYVHRKGATSAREGEVGLIPGSQGTSSYVVKGKGVAESLTSCSHGAGRRMGRGQAQRTLNLADEIGVLNAKGVIHSIRNAKDLDEAPGAYKSIETVMSEQEDLVDIIVKLEPLAVIKG